MGTAVRFELIYKILSFKISKTIYIVSTNKNGVCIVPYKNPLDIKSIEKARHSRRKWYNKNKQHAKQKVLQRKKIIQEWFNQIKSSFTCKNCGMSHIATLDFHHKNPKEKEVNIHKAVHNGWSKEKIENEMSKCDILCSNCHRIHHYNERIGKGGET